MLEILKKIASIALDVQHIQRISNVLYSNANISTENIEKLCNDMKVALDNISTDINLVKKFTASITTDKKD